MLILLMDLNPLPFREGAARRMRAGVRSVLDPTLCFNIFYSSLPAFNIARTSRKKLPVGHMRVVSFWTGTQQPPEEPIATPQEVCIFSL